MLNNLISFAVQTEAGPERFFEANRVRVRRGRLVFLVGLWRVVGIVERGHWLRVMAGIAPEDIGQ